MEEPPVWLEANLDLAARERLPKGSFSGLVTGDAPRTLSAMLGAPPGVEVVQVVENSPAQAAGVEVGDLLLEADVGAGPRVIEWASEWRELEQAAPAGTRVSFVVDRAGVELELELELEARVAHAAPVELERVREEERIGVVLRNATDVEASQLGVGPGGGAVVVGLARSSPWRGVVQYGDAIYRIDGEQVAHPAVVLSAVRARDKGDRVVLELLRDGEKVKLKAPVSRRASQLESVSVPLLYSYERRGDRKTTSVLLGLLKWTRTPAAWRTRLLWFIRISGGNADRLQEVDG